jgi:hypothetical protein
MPSDTVASMGSTGGWIGNVSFRSLIEGIPAHDSASEREVDHIQDASILHGVLGNRYASHRRLRLQELRTGA